MVTSKDVDNRLFLASSFQESGSLGRQRLRDSFREGSAYEKILLRGNQSQ